MTNASNIIVCPKCKTQIEVAHALSEQLSAKVRAEVENDLAGRQAVLEKEAAMLKQRKDALDAAEKSVADRIQAGVAKERQKLEAEVRQKAAQELAVELKDKEEQLAGAKAKLKAAQDAELAIRKRERALQEKTEALELEVARTLDAERARIREHAKKQASEEHFLHDAEKSKQIDDLRRQIDDLKRKAEQGSQQLQGEVQELALEDLLRASFPQDTIEPVSKGARGGDVIQQVRAPGGGDCGAILWESKRTKTWSDGWLAKVRGDQRAAKAVQAVIVTEAMPKDVVHFTAIDGVWVTGWPCAMGLALALRAGLIDVAKACRALVGRQGKMDHLYRYLSGIDFKNRVTGIAEAFISLRDDLETEKRAAQRLWAKREKQLDRAIMSTTGMYGDLQGIIGGNLAQIESLDLPRLQSGEQAIEPPREGA